MTKTPEMRIENKTVISPKKKHRYKSFPTMVRDGPNTLLVAYRDGFFSELTAPLEAGEHGLKGDIYLALSYDNGSTWASPTRIYDNRILKENEQHGILSKVDDTIFLVSRLFGEKFDVFIAHKKAGGKTFSKRIPIASPGNPRFWTPFGHIIKDYEENLLLPIYGIPFNIPPHLNRLTAAVMRSTDNGKTWQYQSVIATGNTISFNETEIVKISKKRLLAFIRTEGKKGELYCCVSSDNACTWSPPRKSGIRGDAPALLAVAPKTLLMTYRGYREDHTFGFHLSLSMDDGKSWSKPLILSAYRGSKYDGGYGDIVQISKDTFISVCYTCDSKRQPWIEGSVIKIKW